MIKTPVAFIVFNRPRHTRETFAAIRTAQPEQLFIIADGARATHDNDATLCDEVRKIVAQVDWPCQVHKNYANENLGLKRRVSTGLDWVFSTVERAIILEDDCVTHPDFFTYCEALLNRYEQDERVWVISGDNHQKGKKRGDASYYFSKYADCWGWATWRRAWQHYQGDISFWPEWQKSQAWRQLNPANDERAYWEDIFSRVHSNTIHSSWFYPWLACVWYHGGITATANVNLVSNIGIGPDATHTITLTEQPGAPVDALGAIAHPNRIEINPIADRFAYNHRYDGLKRQFPRNLMPLPRKYAGAVYRYLKHRLQRAI
jgi:hypothetical protein